MAMWEFAPDIVLEEIFSLLTIPQRYSCSRVCRHWYETFFSPRLWRHLALDEHSFTRRRYIPYKGYQYEINHRRLQVYLGAVGHHSRRITFAPISNFYNLYTFLEVLTCFLEFFDDYPMPCLEQFDFTFACESRGVDSFITGTGGQILAELKKLLGNLHGLVRLRVNHLLLDLSDAPGLLDNVLRNCRDTLRVLEVLDCTKKHFPLMIAAQFPALETLVLSPQQLSSELLLKLASQTPSLEVLVIVQDRYSTINGTAENETAISHQTWMQVKQVAPNLRVRLECRGITDSDVVFEDGAPVNAVIYRSPMFKVFPSSVIQVVDNYRHTLKVYAHIGLPRRHQPRSFQDRADTLLVLLVRECLHLETLVIRDRVSTATLLVIASDSPKTLTRLVVRKNAVIVRCDWPRSKDWTDDYYAHLRSASDSYDSVEAELKKRFSSSWKMLSDREFQRISL